MAPPSARDGPSVGKVVDRQLVPARLAVEPVILPSPPPFGDLERFVYVGKLDRFRGRGRDPLITRRRGGRIWPGAHLAAAPAGTARCARPALVAPKDGEETRWRISLRPSYSPRRPR